MHNVITH